MFKQVPIFLALLLLPLSQVLAGSIKGKLDDVSFVEETIEVDGVIYGVSTETTKVIYNGELMGEEDLQPGDDVELIFGRQSSNRKGKRELKAVILLSGSKSELDS